MRPLVLSIVAGLSQAAPLAVRAQALATADEVAQLRAQVARLQREADLVPLLASAVGLLAVAVGLMGWQLWRRRTPPDARHAPAPQAPAAAPPQAERVPPATTSFDTTPEAASAPVRVTVAQPPGSSAHGLSIEEHVDVDQQAQFLLVLGQDEAAIDLLLDHLRGTGGTSPLPYLRLMQIYRKRGDQPAYERTRERFNLRFNALAPQWQADPASQLSLEAYPGALGEVQRAWHSPLDAMAVIESLLFRRGSEDERFDLPAYEELLFLYWLTRELQQLADSPPSQVDVLLPLDDHVAEVSVIEREAPPPVPGRAPGMVDLDLSTVPGPADDPYDR
ncbi:MAG: hypothetical protein AB1430_11730 [Pseudomonadota bacterium]